jgi:hypothetical protein
MEYASSRLGRETAYQGVIERYIAGDVVMGRFADAKTSFGLVLAERTQTRGCCRKDPFADTALPLRLSLQATPLLAERTQMRGCCQEDTFADTALPSGLSPQALWSPNLGRSVYASDSAVTDRVEVR